MLQLKRECLVPSQPVMRVVQAGTMGAPMLFSFLPHLSMVTYEVWLAYQILHSNIGMIGTLTRWHLHPAQWLHRLPDEVSFEEGSLCEPLAVALAGIERSGLRLGDPLLIW